VFERLVVGIEREIDIYQGTQINKTNQSWNVGILHPFSSNASPLTNNNTRIEGKGD
jgi:hypothetical protein